MQQRLAATVALRKESVDRNWVQLPFPLNRAWSLSARRAWIEISRAPPTVDPLASLSARRAWIEIDWAKSLFWHLGVALRKESVDRNVNLACKMSCKPMSLSARRAWIEISAICCRAVVSLVALRKESVDRNWKLPLGTGD